MKKIIYLLFLLVVIVSCDKDKDIPLSFVEISDTKFVSSYNTLEVECTITTNTDITAVCMLYSTDSLFNVMDSVYMSEDKEQYVATIKDLQSGTKYFVRLRVSNPINSMYSHANYSFSTLQYALPSVQTEYATTYTDSSVLVSCRLIDDGGYEIIERGCCWDETEEPTIEDYKILVADTASRFKCEIKDIKKDTAFYFRAYAINKMGVSYGESLRCILYSKTEQPEQSEQPEPTIPNVQTLGTAYITYTLAICEGEVVLDGGAEVIERGICYSETQNPTINDIRVKNGAGIGSFVSTLSELSSGTTYYYRAYAINTRGTAYGEVKEFTTFVYGAPQVTTSEVSHYTYNSLVTGGIVISDGAETISERGVCYATHPTPTTSDSKIQSGVGTGTFTTTITNLTAQTKYYIRAYAINSAGTTYGQEIVFTTPSQPSISEPSEGALPGVFSVSATKKVRFSQGNLQYQASTNTWRFAENQYDYVGSGYKGNVYENGVICDNMLKSSTYSGWIDLFGWGTSGYDNTANDPAANNFQPWCIRNSVAPSDSTLNCSAQQITGQCEWDYIYPPTTYNEYGYGPSTNMPDKNLTGTSANYDWGVYNPISNGGNQAGLWRTLTKEEWEYILNERNNSNYLYAVAKVDNISGVILLPDNFIKPSDINWTPNAENNNINTYTITQWKELEGAGAVFLPTTGLYIIFEDGHVNYYINHTSYWTTTYVGGVYSAYLVDLNIHRTTSGDRNNGVAVRLVQDIK